MVNKYTINSNDNNNNSNKRMINIRNEENESATLERKFLFTKSILSYLKLRTVPISEKPALWSA